MSIDPERRAAILDAVAAWLDAHPDELLPAGIDPALADDPTPPPDLGAMVAAVLACRHEVKLQTKTFKRLVQRLDDTLAEVARERADAARLGDPAVALIELVDRLRRCELACADAQRDIPLLSRRAAVHRLVDGIGTGIALTAARAGELLAAHGLRAFAAAGDTFDPTRMRAVGQGNATATIATGHVLEVVRVGFARDGGVVVRPAEVVVARDHRDNEQTT